MWDINTPVVCVDDVFSPPAMRHLRNFPVRDHIYHVRDCKPGMEVDGKETCLILLVEIVNPPSPVRPDWGECGFHMTRFRELTEEEQINYARKAEESNLVATY